MFPVKGYVIMDVPENYEPIRTPARKLDQTPLPQEQQGFQMQEDVQVPEIPGNLRKC
jgi:splicing factor 3B subunit 1